MDRQEKEKMRAELRSILQEGRQAFKGGYSTQLKELEELSRADLDKITPDTTDLEAYDNLVAIVRRASAQNWSQAELRECISEAGELVIRIAKKIPNLLS